MRGYFNNNIPGRQPHHFPEVSGLRTHASTRESDAPNRMHLKLGSESVQLTQLMLTVRQIQSTLDRLRIRSGGNSIPTGFHWQTPNKELDPTISVSKDTWVYISALNTLVTTGMTDLVSNATVISCEGYWVALQDVPAATGGKWNVPVFPYPGMGTAIPSVINGSLSGDLDNQTPPIIWAYMGQVAC